MAKKQPFWRQLAALNIEGLGEETCKNLADRFDNLEAIVNDDLSVETARKIINDRQTFQNFIAFLGNAREELNALDTLGLKFQKEAPQNLKLNGKVFAITGGLMSGSRDVVVDRIRACGGVVKSNASALCTHMVVGTGGGRIKAEKAAKYAIPQITEQELYDMMGVPMPLAAQRDPNHEF